MTELPSLFDSRGIFIPLDDAVLASLGELERTAYHTVRDASAIMVACDTAVQSAEDGLSENVQLKNEAEQYLTDNFPKPTFQDLWRETRRGAN